MALQDVLAELAVNLRLDTAAYSTGVDKASQKTSQLERRLTAFQKSAGGIARTMTSLAGGLAGGFAAGFGVDAIVRATDAALKYAGSLAETAQQLGVTAHDLQVFRFAAGQVGVSQEQLEVGLKKLTITMGDLQAGAEGPRKAFEAVHKGLADQIAGAKDAGEAFRILADALQPVASRASRAKIETVAMGKAGSALDNMLSGGSAALNELSAAAEKLGIVLSQEQIDKADETADKLEALKTVLSARIAGVVADNAQSILGFADSLVYLVGKVGDALSALAELRAWFAEAEQLYSIPAQIKRAAGVPVNAQGLGQVAQNGGSVTVKLPPARPVPAKPGTGTIGKFLAPKEPKEKADHSADDAMRKRLEDLSRAHEYDQRQLRAQEDVLRAQQQLSDDYTERTAIGVQMLDLDRKDYAAQLAFEVQENQISKGKEGINQAQADILMALYDQKDGLDRDNLIKQEELDRQREFEANQETFYSLQQDRLKAEDSLAETAAERRRIELEILDVADKEKRERLERIIKESKDWGDIERARKELAAMPAQHQLDQANVNKSTRGPLEEYLASLPLTAEKTNEALQRIEVDGLQRLEDGILGVITGTKKLKDAFHEMAAAILEDLLRLAIEKYIIGTIANALGMPTPSNLAGARAGGGPVLPGNAYLVGEKGPEIFTPSSSGNIVSNDNMAAFSGNGGQPRLALTFHNDFRGSDPAAVAAISGRLDRFERDFPTRVVAVFHDARSRFAIRG